MKNINLGNLIVIISISLLSNACSIFVGQDSIKDLTQTFFVGEEGTQYFIKPLEFESDNGNEMYLDITFRYKDEIRDSATINFTIETDLLVKKLDSVTISNRQDKFTTSNVELLFAEKDEDVFKSRFSIKMPMIELNKLFINQNWLFSLDHSNGNLKYYSTSNTKSALKILNDDLFVIFR